MIIYLKDGGRYIYLTGYGTLTRNLTVRLNKYEDVELYHIGMDREWEDVDRGLIPDLTKVKTISGLKTWDITFHICPPSYIKPDKGINIIYTQNAISKIRPLWVELLKEMDVIIVPSLFDQSIFIREGLQNVHVVHQSSDHTFYTPKDEKAKPFMFLNVGSYGFRKGHDLLLQAYKKAFGNSKDVQLYIKTGRGDYGAIFKRHIIEYAMSDCNVVLDGRLSSPDEMLALYHKASCLVNPSRGEGWNMPATEAMCCEVPVILPNSTAHTEYANNNNAYLIDTKAVMLKSYERTWFNTGWLNGYADIPEGCLYDVDVDKLASTMKHVYEHYSEAKAKGVQARKDIIEKFSWDKASQEIYNIIKSYSVNGVIKESRKIPDMIFK